MPDITNYLAQILAAKYGQDVRSAIHSSIQECYNDGKAGAIDLIARAKIGKGPDGVYPTFAALASANPDHGGVYLVTADGKWYWWNGTAFVAGGVYQSTSNQQQVDSLYDRVWPINAVVGNNLYNKAESVDGGYYYYDTGDYYADVTYTTSAYMPCEPNTNYSFNRLGHLCFWGANKAFLRGSVNANWSDFVTVDSGNNAAYMTISILVTQKDYLMLSEGELPTEEFTFSIPGTLLDSNQIENRKILENLKDYKVTIPVVWELGATTDGTDDAVSETINRTEYFTIPSSISAVTAEASEAGHLVCWFGYDAGYAVIAASSVWAASLTIPNTCVYYRVYHDHGAHNALNLHTTVSISADMFQSGGKYPYQSGQINFTISVNNAYHDLTDDTNATTDSEDMEDVTGVIMLPSTYTSSGNPTKLLMICHGSTSGVAAGVYWGNNPYLLSLVDDFLDAGYAIFDVNGYDNTAAGHEHWGAPMGLQAYRKAYEYVTARYNVTNTFSIYGFSMGGLTALNLAFQRMPGIKCLCLGAPVVNVKDQCWDNGVNNYFVAAYNFVGAIVWEPEKVIGCNPVDHIVAVDATDYVFKTLPPTKIWFGTADLSVDETFAQNLVTAIRNANGLAEYRSVLAAGHEICYGANSAINAEYVMWINRHNE